MPTHKKSLPKEAQILFPILSPELIDLPGLGLPPDLQYQPFVFLHADMGEVKNVVGGHNQLHMVDNLPGGCVLFIEVGIGISHQRFDGFDHGPILNLAFIHADQTFRHITVERTLKIRTADILMFCPNISRSQSRKVVLPVSFSRDTRLSF